MQKLHDFYNDGFGWICRHCVKPPKKSKRSRLLSEGEAESKKPTLSSIGLAKWADPAQRSLMCPTCGITELVDIR